MTSRSRFFNSLRGIRFVNTLLCIFVFTSCLGANEALPLEEERALQQSFVDQAHEPGAVLFTPPQGWHVADPKQLPPSVKVMVVGKGQGVYPPSINLATEKFTGTLKQYLKIVKEINDRSGGEWKDLGTIRTEAGDASLSQTDAKSKWGVERMMHAILVKDGIVYILTSAALKEDFPHYYKEFFTAMRSLRFNKDAYAMVSDAKRKIALEKAVTELKQRWELYYQQYLQQLTRDSTLSTDNFASQAFESAAFQDSGWIPFKNKLQSDFADLGPVWQRHFLNRIQEELLTR